MNLFQLNTIGYHSYMRRSENIVEVKIHCQIQAEKACN